LIEGEMDWSLVEWVIAPSAEGAGGESPSSAVSGGGLGVGGRLGERSGRGGGNS
jgi:hypothetical protein